MDYLNNILIILLLLYCILIPIIIISKIIKIIKSFNKRTKTNKTQNKITSDFIREGKKKDEILKQKQIEETNIHKKLHRVHIEIEGNKFTVTLIDTENNETILLPQNKHIKMNANILIKDDCIEYGLDDESDEYLISDLLIDIVNNPTKIQEYIIYCGENEYKVISETLLSMIFEHFSHILIEKGIKQHEIEITTNQNQIITDRMKMAFIGMIGQTQRLYEGMEMKYEMEMIEQQMMIMRELYFRINNNHLDKLLEEKYKHISMNKMNVIKRFIQNKIYNEDEERENEFEMRTKVNLLNIDEKDVVILPREY